MTRLLLALALAPLSCDGSSGIPVDALDTWTGWQRYRFGNGSSVTDLNCDIYWNVDGVASNGDCRDCEFAFDLTLTLDEDRTVNDGSCVDVGDMEMTYGYVEDWYGSGPTVGSVDMDTFTPIASATWDERAGTLSFVEGNLGYEMGAYYYVDYLEGYGLIETPADRDGDDTGGDDTGTR